MSMLSLSSLIFMRNIFRVVKMFCRGFTFLLIRLDLLTDNKYAKLCQRFGACFRLFSEDITFNVQSWKRKHDLEIFAIIVLFKERLALRVTH